MRRPRFCKNILATAWKEEIAARGLEHYLELQELYQL